METFDLGNFRLAAGFTIPNAKLAYTTHGTLNAAKDNAVLFPNFLGGSDQALEIYIGEGLALDPRKYFIILPGQFGNGFSSSPSNTPPPFDRGAFPPIPVADDVIAQHRLLTEHFGIERLQLVLGWSVGALQTYEWAVRFPQMVEAHGVDRRRAAALSVDTAVAAHRDRGADHLRPRLEQWILCRPARTCRRACAARDTAWH